MKKIICLLLALSLTLLLMPASYAQDANLDTLKASDVNGDGVVNILDLTLIASRFGAIPTEGQSTNPDVNGDGMVNILDLTLVAGNLGKTVRPPVAFVSANPGIDAQLDVNATITLTFDDTPEDVTVSTGTVTIIDQTVNIMGPFDPGSLALTVTWTDGSQTLNYTIRPPASLVSADPVSDSKIDVNGTITLTFDNTPDDVTVSTGTATVTDKTVAITGPFDPGPLALTVTWADGSQTLTYTIRPPVTFVRANPADGSELAVDDTITLTFDSRPNDLTVNTGTAQVIAKKVRITGPFDPGALALTITWADGSQTLTYTVATPDTEAPEITGGTVNDGDKSVDPEAINSRGQIEIAFSEEVTGNITLRTKAGVNAGWLGKVDGNTGILELVKGKELGNEIIYVIGGKVSDAAGNETRLNITFTTESKTSGIPFEVTDATFNTLVLQSEIPVVVEFYTDW
jgi:hypothetical protein